VNPVSSHPSETSDAGLREARYANYFEVGSNQEEIVIDLGQAYGAGAPVSIHTRIVTSPVYARELVRLLRQATGDFPEERQS
jgi:hypothetical protein